ncbi:peptidoglycan editing factor PgeF [Bacillus sp. 165]|uniref:peptidoglycan editing factor PgeF n=1 Tax=Bacillus sp. 165 TaxID=1529117 RepID=UPI001ADBA0B8|nr:peptidoglycan editing factor PgeF [Bacillus sp. 165]MBO9130252.1 peptidoglycan editing factor PgeF [Bacillus sp. 165]
MKQEPFQYDKSVMRLNSWEAMNPALTVGFTTKEDGSSEGDYSTLNLGLHVNDREEAVHQNRRLVASKLHFPLHTWVCSEQIHENRVVKVTQNHKGKGVFQYGDGIPGTDGIYTNEPNVLLTSCYADCVPLYFYAPSAGMIGLAHAGWKGTVKNIVNEMITKWTQQEGIAVEDIYVTIGPAIGSCCYVVDDRVIQKVEHVLHDAHLPFHVVSEGQYQLDLKEVNRLLCRQAGIQEDHILVSSLCTSCEENLFFSHRRDKGKTGRMLSFIGLKEE